MRKYFFAIRSAFLQQLKEPGQLLGRLLLFVVIVYLFHQVFGSVGAPNWQLWYYAMTEAIILATAPLVLQISNDIRSNHTVYFLLRPVNYCTFRFCEAMGGAVFRYILLMILALCYVPLLRGAIPSDFFSLLSSLFIGLLGIFLYTLISLLIGLLSAWIKDIKTLLYFNLTATFCFGGLIIPIVYYPPLMQTICFCTPYPWILWWPGSLFAGTEINHLQALLGWNFWTIVFLAANRYVFNRYKKNLVMEGG